MPSNSKTGPATIDVICRSLGYNDSRPLARKITEFWKSVYKAERFVECDETELQKLAHDFLEEHGHRFWGTGNFEYPLWPDRKDTLRNGVTGILRRQRRNQHDQLTRKRARSNSAEDHEPSEEEEDDDDEHTTELLIHPRSESLNTGAEISRESERLSLKPMESAKFVDGDVVSAYRSANRQQHTAGIQPDADARNLQSSGSKSITTQKILQDLVKGSTSDILSAQDLNKTGGGGAVLSEVVSPALQQELEIIEQERKKEQVTLYMSGEVVKTDAATVIVSHQNLIDSLERSLFDVQMKRPRAATEQEKLLLQRELNVLKRFQTMIEADVKSSTTMI